MLLAVPAWVAVLEWNEVVLARTRAVRPFAAHSVLFFELPASAAYHGRLDGAANELEHCAVGVLEADHADLRALGAVEHV